MAALDRQFAASERGAKLVNEVICRHFYRTGLPELGALLVQVSRSYTRQLPDCLGWTLTVGIVLCLYLYFLSWAIHKWRCEYSP